MNWPGYTIFQNEDFLKLYCGRNKRIEVMRLGNDVGRLLRIPILGKVLLNMVFPKAIEGAYKFCESEGIYSLLLSTTCTLEDKYLIKNGGTVIVELDRGLDSLWSDLLHHKTRSGIRQARRWGASVRITEDAGDFDSWWQLYFKASQKKGFPAQAYNTVYDIFKSKYSKLFITEVDGIIASGALILIDESPLFWLGGTDPSLAWARPNNILQWSIIEWAKQQRYHYYDMGGANPDELDGIRRFKLGFGGEFKSYQIYEMPMRGLASKMIKLIRRLN